MTTPPLRLPEMIPNRFVRLTSRLREQQLCRHGRGSGSFAEQSRSPIPERCRAADLDVMLAGQNFRTNSFIFARIPPENPNWDQLGRCRATPVYLLQIAEFHTIPRIVFSRRDTRPESRDDLLVARCREFGAGSSQSAKHGPGRDLRHPSHKNRANRKESANARSDEILLASARFANYNDRSRNPLIAKVWSVPGCLAISCWSVSEIHARRESCEG